MDRRAENPVWGNDMPMRIAALFCFAGIALSTWPVQASPCLGVALVMAIDGSGSVSVPEYIMQQHAVASALRDPDVLQAMEHAGGVAMSVIFWGSAGQPTQETQWTIIRDATDADLLAREIEALPRTVAGDTGLGAAMARSLGKLEELPGCAAKKLVNVSGDGRDTSWRPKWGSSSAPGVVKRLATERGVTINALAISREEPDLPEYYLENVVTQPDGFVMEAPDFAHFAAAIRKKLIREIGDVQVSALNLESAGKSLPNALPIQ